MALNDEKTLQINIPSSVEEFDAVRDLMRSFIAWHKVRHHDQMHLVMAYFDQAAFDAELAGLPGKFASPDGALLLATLDGQPAGCVALRRISDSTCEMKRMFVAESCQGHGVGIALGQAIISKAKELGYSKIVLDSGAKQFEAHSLYRKLGFKDVAPYYELPQDLREWLVFMELTIASTGI